MVLLGYRPKGRCSHKLSQFWFKLLQSKIPSIRTHYVFLDISPDLQERLPFERMSQLQRRSMVVTRLKVFQSRASCEDTSLDPLGAPIRSMALCAGEFFLQACKSPRGCSKRSGLQVRRLKSEGRTRTSVLRMVGDFRSLNLAVSFVHCAGNANHPWCQRPELWDKQTQIKLHGFRWSSTRKPTLAPLSEVSLLLIPSSNVDLTNPERQLP